MDLHFLFKGEIFKGNYISLRAIPLSNTTQSSILVANLILNQMTLPSSVLRKINAKLKFLYQKSIYLIPVFRRLLCNALIQPHLCMFFMASSFKEKFKDQTSKNSKQIYLFLPKFTFEISYRSIAY